LVVRGGGGGRGGEEVEKKSKWRREGVVPCLLTTHCPKFCNPRVLSLLPPIEERKVFEEEEEEEEKDVRVSPGE